MKNSKQLLVTVTKIKDIRDKELNYLIIGEGEKKVIINVGEKTFNQVKEITEGSNEIKQGKITENENEKGGNKPEKPKLANKLEK